MIPMKTSTIFKSRWMACVWAAGIIWFALQMSSPGDEDTAAAANGMTAAATALAPGDSSAPGASGAPSASPTAPAPGDPAIPAKWPG